MLKLLVLLFSLNFLGSSAYSQPLIEGLVRCLDQAKAAKIIKDASLVSRTTKVAAKIPNAFDNFLGSLLYVANGVPKAMIYTFLKNEKSAFLYADFINMGIQKGIIKPKYAQKLIEGIRKSDLKNNELIKFFQKMDGSINYTKLNKVQSSNETKALFKSLREIQPSNKNFKLFIDELERKSVFSVTTKKYLLDYFKQTKYFPQSSDEAKKLLNFVMHIDSKVLAKKNFLIKNLDWYHDIEKIANISRAKRTKEQKEFLKVHKKFLKLESQKDKFEVQRFKLLQRNHDTQTAAKLAKRDAQSYADLRYICRARGESAVRNSSSGLFKKYSFGIDMITTAGFYTLNGGFTKQEKGGKIFLHNMFNQIIMSTLGPKIIMGADLSNFGKVINAYLSKAIFAVPIDKYSYRWFIENDATGDIDYVKMFKGTNLNDKISELEAYLSEMPSLKKYISEINKIPQDQLSGDKIVELIKELDIDINTPSIDESLILDDVVKAMVAKKYDEKASGKIFNSGTEAADRANWNLVYGSYSAIRSLAKGIFLYTNLCQGFRFNGRIINGKYDPIKAQALATIIFGIDITASSLIYRRGLLMTTGQR